MYELPHVREAAAEEDVPRATSGGGVCYFFSTLLVPRPPNFLSWFSLRGRPRRESRRELEVSSRWRYWTRLLSSRKQLVSINQLP